MIVYVQLINLMTTLYQRSIASWKTLLFSLLLIAGITSSLTAQTVFQTRISAATDDYEEYIDGVKLGQFDEGSSDLEMTTEGNGTQIIGLRFLNITIPKGTVITKAYIQFAADESHTEPTNLIVKGVAQGNAPAIDTVNKISTRPLTTAMTNWPNIPEWIADAVPGTAERTADISAIVTEIVARTGWASGNAIMFVVSGTGKRVADSYDGSTDRAPLLYIEYGPAAPPMSVSIANATDDMEEFIDGAKLGQLDIGSSDLEMVNESGGNQIIGLRFNGITAQKNAVIKSAYIQFAADETHADPTSLIIHGQASDNAVTFDSSNKVVTRPKTAASVAWNAIPAWTADAVPSAAEQTPDLKAVLQEIVSRSGWAAGNSAVFLVTGTGKRVADSYDGSVDRAAKLIYSFEGGSTPVTTTLELATDADDMEEYVDSSKVGQFDVGSSDLEMTKEGNGNQIIGLRFANVPMAKGAVITNAYIQFAADESHTGVTNLILHGQASDNSVTFDTLNKVSTRPKTTASVAWNNIPAWVADTLPGTAERTPELKTIVQEIVNRAAWATGNAMTFFVTGTGKRVADSREGSSARAAKLVITYESNVIPTNPAVDFPLKKKEQWSYYAAATAPDVSWKNKTFDDASWMFAKAPLGYGIAGASTIPSGFTTSYFRKKVNVANLSTLAPKLALNLNADDGAVVYINGVEVARQNMPAGAVTNTTNATKDITGTTQKVYFMYELDKSVLTSGENVIAVEVHQAAGANTDLSFDAELRESTTPINPPSSTCTGSTDAHISCFTSLLPTEQDPNLHIPSTHTFQRLLQDGDAYTVGGGNAGTNNDFTGYVPKNGSSENGYVLVNHETSPGGVTVLDMSFNKTTHLWKVNDSRGVDFAPQVKTVRNCSGGVTPWGTSITSEEATDAGDANADGYEDIGWNVEIDPATASIKDYGAAGKQKLWAMGRMDHENVAVKNDSRTVYQGEDDSRGCVYKFVATTEGNLSEGELFGLKLNQPLASGEPTGTTGTWVKIPNTTKTDRNSTHDLAIAAQCTEFSGVEDVEIGTVDGKIYFTAKGLNRTYSFSDNGTTVSNFMTFVGGKAYNINTGEGVVAEDWGSGNDNLTFDDRGNLYVLQDGGRNHIWVVKPDHTQAAPKVEIFAKMPGNAEPTGMTFSPDNRFMFVSVQTPNGANTASVKDAAGLDVIFNKSTTLVIGRKEFLGAAAGSVRQTVTPETFKLAAFPNPFTSELSVSFALENTSDVEIALVDATGNTVGTIANTTLGEGAHTVNFTPQATLASGMYFVRLVAGGLMTTIKVIAQ